MRDELRQALESAAIANGRTLTAEINERLRDSLNASKPGIAPSRIQSPHMVQEAPAYLTGRTAEDAMLDIFRAMPPEKQLALLSLFK